MDYNKLNWQSDWMHSEIFDSDISDEDDRAIGLYSIKDFPEIQIYVDYDNGTIVEAWVVNEDE